MFSEGDVAMLTESSSRPLSAVFQNIHRSSLWRSRKGHLSFNQVTVHIQRLSMLWTSLCAHRYALNHLQLIWKSEKWECIRMSQMKTLKLQHIFFLKEPQHSLSTGTLTLKKILILYHTIP